MNRRPNLRTPAHVAFALGNLTVMLVLAAIAVAGATLFDIHWALVAAVFLTIAASWALGSWLAFKRLQPRSRFGEAPHEETGGEDEAS